MSDENTQNTAVAEDLPQEIIIIVGCICGSIVVILTVVLIVLCCKRQKSKQNYEKQETRMSPVLGSSPSPDPSDSSKPKPGPGLDNPGLDQVDNSVVDMDRSHDGPFMTHASGHNPNNMNMPYDNRRPNNDAHGQQWNGHTSSYDNHQNEPPSKQNDKYGPPPSYPEAQRMSTDHDEPEPHKPKKVIYEVVV